MKLLSFIFILFSGVTRISGGINSLVLGEYEEGQRYFLYGGEDGKLSLIDLHAEEPNARFDAEKSVKFILHTRKGKQDLVYGNNAGLANSNYDAKKPVNIVIHGWQSNSGSEINQLITEAFYKNADQNVIVVDWGKGAFTLYSTAARNVIKVGALVGKLVDWLIENGTPINNVHLIGHSLGSHCVGIAGRSVKKGKVPYITGMSEKLKILRVEETKF
ncbi:endothelial lipase-like [Arctopsyche grandis]|uniref:endothelial lipase-like n=1 Tax=Arctopsyche grandis TaxID=121162 RepID=UPI00406D6AFC